MPIPRTLLDRITDYRAAGYSDDDIVAGLSQSQNYADVAGKVQAYQSQGYGASEILYGMLSSDVIDDAPNQASPATPRQQAAVQSRPIADIYADAALQGDAFNANTPERNGWVTRGLQAVPEILKKQFAGMEYGAEKLAAQTYRGGYDPTFGEVDLSARPANNAPLTVYKDADKRIQELRPKADEGAVAQYGFDIASNVGAQIPNLLAGGALGEGLALTAMGAMSGADKYVDLSESGVTGPKAALGAGIVGTGEAATELLPMKALLNKTLPLVKRLVLHAVADVPGEVVQMINENAVDWWMKTPNASVRDLEQKIKEDFIPTVITSFGSALVLGSGAHATHRIMQERARGKSTDPHQPITESQGVQAPGAAPALTRETMQSVMPETQEDADELIKMYGEGKESAPVQQQGTDPHQPMPETSGREQVTGIMQEPIQKAFIAPAMRVQAENQLSPEQQAEATISPDNSAIELSPLQKAYIAEKVALPQAQQAPISPEPIPQVGANTPQEVADATQKTERLLSPPDVSTQGAGQVEMPAPVSQQNPDAERIIPATYINQGQSEWERQQENQAKINKLFRATTAAEKLLAAREMTKSQAEEFLAYLRGLPVGIKDTLGKSAIYEVYPDLAPRSSGNSWPKTVQRIEEPGVQASFNKLHGLYTTPGDVESPHTDLGGQRYEWTLNPEAKTIDIPEYQSSEVAMRKGAINAGAGVHAARHFLGAEEFKRLKGMSKAELAKEAQKKYLVDFSKYHDRQEIMEAIGALEARKAGYDAFRVVDPDPQFSEIVLLNKRAVLAEESHITPKPDTQPAQKAPAMKPQAPQAKKALPDIRTFFINSGGISLPIESKGGYSGELRKLREEMGKWEGNKLVRTLKVGGAVSLDDALTRAKEAGYLPEDATQDDLIEALREKKPHPVTAEDALPAKLDIENERRENMALRRRIERNISRLKKEDPTLTNDELRELSFIDKDTGLPNKLAYERDLDKNMDGVTVAIDMNGLKYVNDTFGHGAGDEFINQFGAIMQTDLGSHFYRIGGDEFAAIFPNRQDADDAMSTLQEVVKELQFEITANDGSVLVVKGVTFSYGTGQGRNAKEHKQSADAELYRDKARAKARGDRPSEPGAKPPRLSVREVGRRDNIDPFEDNSGANAGTETAAGEDISQSENIALKSPETPAAPKKAAQVDMFGAKTGLEGPVRAEGVDLTKDNLFTRADTVQAEKNAKEDAEKQASLYDEIDHKPDTISEEAAPYEAKGTTKEETQAISELSYDSRKAHTVTAKAGKDSIAISAGKRTVTIPVIRKQSGTESGMYYILGDREGKTFALKTSLVNFGTVAINIARNGYDNLRATPEIVSRGEDITNLSDDEGKFLYSGIHVPTMIDQIRTTFSKSRDTDGNISYEGIRESDLKALEEVWNLPNWIAQEHPEFMQHKQIEVDRQERREEMLHELLQSPTQNRAGEHHEFLSLSKEDEAAVAKLIVESDADNRLISKKELEERGITTPQMIAYYAWKRSMDKALELRIENYKKVSLIPYEDRSYYDKLKEIMDMDATGIEARKRAIEIASKMPKVEADAFLTDVDSLTPDKGSIKELRAQLEGMNFYMPRTRGQGEYVARVRDKDGNVIWSERTTSNPSGGALVKIGRALRINEAKRIEKRLRAEFPEARIEWKHEPHTPEFMYQEMTDAAIERFLDKTIEKVREGGKVSSSDLNAVKEAIKQTLVDDLKARGFGKHAIHRKQGAPIGGYKTEGLKQVFVDYMSGAAGFMSKSEAAMRHHLALQNLPNAKPRLMQYAQKYVKDMMRNQTKIDRVSGRLRAMAYTWYLMGNIRFAAVQMTQNYVAAIPELSTHTKRATWKYHKAMSQIASGQGLTAEEKAALDKAYNAGITKDQYLKEVTARIHGGPRNAWRKTIDALSIPFRGMEIFNRKSSFLAAWRVAKYEKNMSSDEAYSFARQFVDNTQFWMSKANLPGWARGEGAASGIARTLYTFKSFQQNYMLLLRKWAKQGPDGYRAIAYSMAWLAAFGGAGAVPFLDDILDLIEQITGYPARKIVKDRLKKYGDVVAKIGTQGIPALIGVDLSGSLKMEVPFLKAASSALTLGQVNAGGGASDVWGVYSGLGQKAAKSAHFVSQKEIYRAAEALAPVFIENAMKGYRQMSGPVLDDKGRPMFDERTGKPFALSTAEGIWQMAGFRPARTADLSKEKRMAQNLDGYFDRRRADITEAYRYAAQAKDKDAIRKVLDDIKEYNLDARKYPKVAAPITGQTLQRAMKPKQNKAVRAFLGLDTAE